MIKTLTKRSEPLRDSGTLLFMALFILGRRERNREEISAPRLENPVAGWGQYVAPSVAGIWVIQTQANQVP